MRFEASMTCWRCGTDLRTPFNETVNAIEALTSATQESAQTAIALSDRADALSRQIDAGECDACQLERQCAAEVFIRTADAVRVRYRAGLPLNDVEWGPQYAAEDYDRTTRPRRPADAA